MAKKGALSFNFGANRKPKTGAKKTRNASKGKSGGKSNAWRSYVGVSNAPIPP